MDSEDTTAPVVNILTAGGITVRRFPQLHSKYMLIDATWRDGRGAPLCSATIVRGVPVGPVCIVLQPAVAAEIMKRCERAVTGTLGIRTADPMAPNR